MIFRIQISISPKFIKSIDIHHTIFIPLVKDIWESHHDRYGHPWEKTSRHFGGADDRRDGARHSQARRHRPEARAQGVAAEKSGAGFAKTAGKREMGKWG